MATWNSRGLRGSTLEDFINRTNERYLDQGLALIQKIPTPITRPARNVAYFNERSKPLILCLPSAQCHEQIL